MRMNTYSIILTVLLLFKVTRKTRLLHTLKKDKIWWSHGHTRTTLIVIEYNSELTKTYIKHYVHQKFQKEIC